MKVEGYIVVVNGQVFEDGVINLGRGATEYDVPMIKIYKDIKHACLEETSIKNNSDGDNDIDIYEINFEVPDPQPTKINASTRKLSRAEINLARVEQKLDR
jgi:hypothetical protein